MGHPHLFKKCGKCKELKSVTEFYFTKKGTKGRDGYCRICRGELARERTEKRSKELAAKIEADPWYLRRKKLLKLYGVTQEQYEAMHESQNGLCAICGKPETRFLYGRTAWLVVDHNHSTGAIRSLLCHRCNTRLGAIEDSEFASKATAYLDSHRSNNA